MRHTSRVDARMGLATVRAGEEWALVLVRPQPIRHAMIVYPLADSRSALYRRLTGALLHDERYDPHLENWFLWERCFGWHPEQRGVLTWATEPKILLDRRPEQRYVPKWLRTLDNPVNSR